MWWSEKPIDMFEGAPFRLSEFMSGRRFQNIGAAIRYTNIESPSFLDSFHDVWHMIDALNEHYDCEYIPSWLNCLDESMDSFLDNFCPGFMIGFPSNPFSVTPSAMLWYSFPKG